MPFPAPERESSVDQFVITPSDSTDLTNIPLALVVLTTGTIRAKGVNSTTYVDYPAFPAGTILPIAVSRVYATGTTATLAGWA